MLVSYEVIPSIPTDIFLQFSIILSLPFCFDNAEEAVSQEREKQKRVHGLLVCTRGKSAGNWILETEPSDGAVAVVE